MEKLNEELKEEFGEDVYNRLSVVFNTPDRVVSAVHTFCMWEALERFESVVSSDTNHRKAVLVAERFMTTKSDSDRAALNGLKHYLGSASFGCKDEDGVASWASSALFSVVNELLRPCGGINPSVVLHTSNACWRDLDNFRDKLNSVVMGVVENERSKI